MASETSSPVYLQPVHWTSSPATGLLLRLFLHGINTTTTICGRVIIQCDKTGCVTVPRRCRGPSTRNRLQNVLKLNLDLLPEGLESLRLVLAITLRFDLRLNNAVFDRYQPSYDPLVVLSTSRIEEFEVRVVQVRESVLCCDRDQGPWRSMSTSSFVSCIIHGKALQMNWSLSLSSAKTFIPTSLLTQYSSRSIFFTGGSSLDNFSNALCALFLAILVAQGFFVVLEQQ